MKAAIIGIGFLFFWIQVGLSQDPSPVARSNGLDDTSQPEKFITIPFELVRGGILVEAEINGKQGVFLFDTGAPTLILNSGKQKGEGAAMVSISESYEAFALRVACFRWAGIELKDLEALVFDMSHLEAYYDRDLRGVIGFRVFADRELLLDVGKQKIHVSQVPDLPFSDVARVEQVIPFSMQGHLPVFEVQLGDSTFRFGFDSGSSGNLIDPKVLTVFPDSGSWDVRERKLHGFSSKPSLVPMVTLPILDVGQFRQVEMEFLVVDFSHIVENGLAIDGLFGLPFVQDRLISVDYPNKRLVFYEKRSSLSVAMP
jgi:hypothetical protein